MSLYKRGKTYWCEWEIGGKRIRETSGTADKAAAQEYHDRRRADLWRVTKLGETPIETWDQATIQWVTEHGQFKKSWETDRVRLKLLTQSLTGKPINTIKTDTILAIRTDLLKTRAAGTANRFMALISAVLNYAHGKDKLAGVPKIPYLKENNDSYLWLTQQQADRLIEELPPHLSLIARFAIATGLRLSNITQLQWSNIDLNRKVAWVKAEDAKANKSISVPLNDDAVELLNEVRKTSQLGYVFLYKGKPFVRATTKAWYKATARACIDSEFTFHDLRHTWASWHVMSGTSLPVLQQLGGWSSLEMVQRYAHLAPDYVASYANNSKRVPHNSTTEKELDAKIFG